MFPAKKRKLWPLRSISNNVQFSVWLSVTIAVWLMWIYKTKLYFINEPVEKNMMVHLYDNVVSNIRSDTITDGILSCAKLRVGDTSLVHKFTPYGILSLTNGKVTFTDKIKLKDGVLSCASLNIMKNVEYKGSYLPLCTSDVKCIVEISNARSDYLVHVDDGKIIPLSDVTENKPIKHKNKYAISQYSLPLFDKGELGSYSMTISKDIVHGKLPKPTKSILYTTLGGELRALPLPDTSQKRILQSNGSSMLTWYEAPAGSWFEIRGQPKTGEIMHFEGGNFLSFRTLHDGVVDNGNVSVVDPEMTLDDSSRLPQFVQFDGIYGRLSRVLNSDESWDLADSIDYMCEIPHQKLTLLTKIPWKNEQDLFKNISAPPVGVSWITYHEREKLLRGDFFKMPLSVGRSKILSSSRGEYTWTDTNEFVVSYESGKYDAHGKRISKTGKAREIGDGMRIIDVRKCVTCVNDEWSADSGRAIYDVADGTDENDAVNYGQCKKLFGMYKTDDGYDAKNKTISKLLDPKEDNDAVPKNYVDIHYKTSGAWFKLDFGYKTDVDKLIITPDLKLLSHPTYLKHNGYRIPCTNMMLKYVFVHSSSSDLNVMITHPQGSILLNKTNKQPYFFSRVDKPKYHFGSVVRVSMEDRDTHVKGVERGYLVTLFFGEKLLD